MKYDQKLSLNKELFFSSINDAFWKLTPRAQFGNPAIFITYLGAITTTLYAFSTGKDFEFNIQIALWLWLTVFFANFAKSISESQGKAHTASLKNTKINAFARQVLHGIEMKIPSENLKKGDIILCETGDVIPADGEVIEGIATVDESAITGESAPVIRESGGDRNSVTAGTKVLSDHLKIKVSSEAGDNVLDKMITLIEGATRQKTHNELALTVALSAFSIIFLLVVVSLKSFGDYSSIASGQDLSQILTIPVLVALLICLIPTTISALLNTIGIIGLDRLLGCNVYALSNRPVEAAADVDLLLLDKTGTITIGNRTASAFLPVSGVDEKDFAKIAQLASLSDETPEGRSIVVLAKTLFGLRAESLETTHTMFIPFSSKTRMSGVDLKDPQGNTTRHIRKGAPDAIRKYIESHGGSYPKGLNIPIEMIARKGGTPLLICDNAKIMGIVHLKDVVKGGISERFAEMRKMGIKTVMITGDNPFTAAAIAAESGVDEYVAEANPEMKLDLIREEQDAGHFVAMTGDGTNDAPALAQADVGVAMNAGTQTSREAGNLIDLDNNPTKLIDIVKIGKQMLMTRGALLTFDISNDIAKYFVLIPAMFATLYAQPGESKGPLAMLNFLHLHSTKSAILSTVIINALTILALIPLALRGVRYSAQPAHILLRRNILIYGLGGLMTPFIAIKIVDWLIVSIGLIE